MWLAIARRGTTDATSSYGKHIPQQGLFLDAISPTQKVEDATLLWLTRHMNNASAKIRLNREVKYN